MSEPSAPAVHERPWAVGVYLAFAALVGLAWAAPLAAAVSSTTTGAYPRGDAELLDPGGVMLVETARHLLRAAATIRAAWAVVAIAALLAGPVVLGFAIALLSARGRARPAWAVARSLRSLPTMALLGVVALLAAGVLTAVIFLGGGAISRAAWPAPPGRDTARIVVIALAAAAWIAVGVLHDLARVAAIAGPTRVYMSMRAALRTAWALRGRVVWAYGWRATASLAALALAALVGWRIGSRSAAALAAAAFVHQLGLAGAGWLRLSWLAAAARMVRPALARPIDEGAAEANRTSVTPERAAVPGEPPATPERAGASPGAVERPSRVAPLAASLEPSGAAIAPRESALPGGLSVAAGTPESTILGAPAPVLPAGVPEPTITGAPAPVSPAAGVPEPTILGTPAPALDAPSWDAPAPDAAAQGVSGAPDAPFAQDASDQDVSGAPDAPFTQDASDQDVSGAQGASDRDASARHAADQDASPAQETRGPTAPASPSTPGPTAPDASNVEDPSREGNDPLA